MASQVTQNKLISYSAKTLVNVKEKLKLYESVCKKSLEEGKMQEKNDAVKKQKISRKPTIIKKTKQQSDQEV